MVRKNQKTVVEKTASVKSKASIVNMKSESSDSDDDLAELIDLTSPAKSSRIEKDVQEIQASCRLFMYGINRHVIEYGCQFYVPPEVQTYYHEPARSELDHYGEPLLLGSPVFDGPMKTKWRVTTTFNRWVHTRRWLPLYLTRQDYVATPKELVLLQCEMRIVDKDKKVLRSMKSAMVETRPGHTRGFTKFLPFEKIREVLTAENYIMIEAYMTIMVVDPAGGSASGNSETELKKTSGVLNLRKNRKKDSDEEWSVPSKPPLKFDGGLHVRRRDKVEFIYNGESIGFLSRKAFTEKSEAYRQLMNDNPFVDKSIRFGNEGKPRFEKHILRSFIMYVNHGECSVLQCGTFEEKFQLFTLSNELWYMPGLLRECLKSMTLNLTVDNAVVVASLLKSFKQAADKSTFERFRKFFRNNIEEIQMHPTFLKLFEEDRQFYFRLAIDPRFVSSLKKLKT